MAVNLNKKSKLNIAFVHPDLGIGGAERLVVDCAVGLQKRGHTVTIFTSFHDPEHCFKETADGTLKVVVHGQSMPRQLWGKFHILCATLRSFVLAYHVAREPKFDVMFVDQITTSLPILNANEGKILFYGHFPDHLLATRTGLLRKIYRMPFDLFEGWTTPFADRIVVNSNFTAETFKRTFTFIHDLPDVVYPGLHLEEYDREVVQLDSTLDPIRKAISTGDGADRKMLLSINRFERKKNFALAIESFAIARKSHPATILVIAGGYDIRLSENIEHHRELEKLAASLGLSSWTSWPASLQNSKAALEDAADPTKREQPANIDVLFVPSFSENQRTFLFRAAEILLYTPSDEHFGIVPIEAMYNRLPVIAVNSGGPMETVRHRITGVLCEADPAKFASAIDEVLSGETLDRTKLGEEGRTRVKNMFSLDIFINQIEKHLVTLTNGYVRNSMFTTILLVGGFALGVVLAYYFKQIWDDEDFWYH
ncbi:UDP-Glycosyltransferase/glycogen phosphorylase [Ramicandelaber brevisporus]|nr:UDP-Glycosyltransferase/glycogen phosphorylase [Ramicandelaber brevisporus]